MATVVRGESERIVHTWQVEPADSAALNVIRQHIMDERADGGWPTRTDCIRYALRLTASVITQTQAQQTAAPDVPAQ